MIGTGSFSEDFKRDAVARTTERGYLVAEVSQRLGVSPHSLYAWKKKFANPADSGEADQAGEIRLLKKELAGVAGERDILKNATAYFARNAKRDARSSPSIAHCFRSGRCVADHPAQSKPLRMLSVSVRDQSFFRRQAVSKKWGPPPAVRWGPPQIPALFSL